MSVAIIRATVGHGGWQDLLAMSFYPIGFIAVIIGRAQLFTENTLFPILLVLDERRHVAGTLRLWTVVFAANIAGALAFALLATRTHALRGEFINELGMLGIQAGQRASAEIFWSAIIGGWLIALVAWLVSASHWTIGQLAVIWLLTFIVGAGHFAHCIAGSGEVLSAVMLGKLSGWQYLRWLALATLGNVVGGIFFVSILNYGQVRAGQQE